MKRLIVACVIAAFVIAIPAMLWGKGHVPSHKTQFCHGGKTIEVGKPAAGAHEAHGDSALPAFDADCVFMKGDPCDNANPCGK